VRKIAGDINLKTKKSKTKRGRTLDVGRGDPSITPAGIQHAVGNEATTRAASEIQKDLGLDFTVPSMMVQESVWAAERRMSNKDKDFNAAKEKPEKTPRVKRSADRPLPGFKDF
jgi:hypothetical protein